jgi:hypothetical protein
MRDIFVLSDSGENFYFENGCIFGIDKNRAIKFELNGRKIIKTILRYGGITYPLHDGKTLIALNKTFYIKE